MLTSEWKSVLLDKDVDQKVSAEVDLEGNYEFLAVIQPELDGGHTLTVHVAMKSGDTFYPTYALDGDSTGDHAQITTGAATTRMIIFNIGGMQYIKVVVGTNTTNSKTFYVRGTDRE